jgi:molybdopterin converting factor small subunit
LLFGAFREYGSALEVLVAEGATAAQIKTAIAETLAAKHPAFRHAGLIRQSALGGTRVVFRDEEVVPVDEELAILPPVCGG